MAREKGTFLVSANYEPQKAAPFDARALVDTKADLFAANTWTNNGQLWIYTGMVVSVSNDAQPENNGIYFLKDVTQFSNEDLGWIKLADLAGLKVLQQQIDNLVIQASGSKVVSTRQELPQIGDQNITYYVRENTEILRWDIEIQNYVAYGSGSTDIEIDSINGGSASVV